MEHSVEERRDGRGVARYADQMVALPGGEGTVRCGDLSVTGGVVNAYEAVKLAEQLSVTKP